MVLRRLLFAITAGFVALRYRLEYRIGGRDYRMPMERASRLCATLFERRLRARGMWYSFDEGTGTYRVENVDGLEGRVSLSNVVRELAGDGDIYRAIRFADNMLSALSYPDDWSKVRHQILWDIQSNTLENQSDLAFHLSDHTHQVPVLYDPETKHILFLTSHMLIDMSVSEEDVAQAANENLSAALRNSELMVRELEGVRAGFIHSTLPFKAALILAPNLGEIAEPILGWPLLAVIPNRDSVYLFNGDDFDGVDHFVRVLPGLGDHVLDRFEFGAYPLSTEIFEITDKGVRAIAEFSRHPPSDALPSQ